MSKNYFLLALVDHEIIEREFEEETLIREEEEMFLFPHRREMRPRRSCSSWLFFQNMSVALFFSQKSKDWFRRKKCGKAKDFNGLSFQDFPKRKKVSLESWRREKETSLIDWNRFDWIQFQLTFTNDRRGFTRRIKKRTMFNSDVRNGSF